MNLSAKIEAVLFFKNEPLSIKKLSDLLIVSEQEVMVSLGELEKNLEENKRGITLMFNGGEVSLGTNKEVSVIIEKIIKDELHRDLGKAGLETLSIILYLGPVSKGEIDFIRGVSSTSVIRNLSVRGLVSRAENLTDKRILMYKPTFELLSYLGVSKVEDLPEYHEVLRQIKNREGMALSDIENTTGRNSSLAE